MNLKSELLRERLGLYVRLRGGYPFPLAGAIWWAAMSLLGFRYPLKTWTMLAFIGSGLIFPLALLLSRIARIDTMGAKSSIDDLMAPAFIGMLLFWPMAFAAYWSYVELAPLIVAIGMSMHWPVIGWTYGRTALYSAHSVVRAIAALLIWVLIPEGRTTWLPASVSVVYLLTVIAILIDTRRLQQQGLGVAQS